MFQLADNDSIKWPVIVHVPQDGGKTKKQQFTAEFKVMDQDELDKAVADSLTDSIFLSKVTVGWADDLQDEKGDPLPFSKDTCLRIGKITYVLNAMLKAFYDAQSGNAAKN